MAAKIYSKLASNGKQSLYLKADGKEYYLFTQNYRVSVKNYYQTPITINRALDFSCADGIAVKKTMEKLRAYIPYVEKEFGIFVLNKTTKAQRSNKTGRRRCGYDEEKVA